MTLVRGQNVDIVNISDRLPDKHVKAVVQDSFHFIWLATSTGFQVYDGVKISQYKPPGFDAQQFVLQAADQIISSDPYIIANNNKRLQIIDSRDRSIVYTSPDSLIITQVFGDDKIKYLLFESEALSTVLLEFKAGHIRQCAIDLPGDERIARINRSDEFYYLSRTGKLYRQEEGDPAILIDSTTFYRRRVLYMPEIIVDGGEVYFIYSQMGASVVYHYKDSSITPVLRLPDNTSYINKDKGSYYFFNKEKRSLLVYKDFLSEYSGKIQFPDDVVTVVNAHKDNNENIWICWSSENDSHLSLYNGNEIKFKVLGDENLLVRNIVCLENGELKVTAQNGIFFTQNGRSSLKKCPDLFPKWDIENWWKIVVDEKRDRLWVTRSENGLYLLDLECNYNDHFFNTDPYTSNRMTGMLMDNNGLLWISTISGLTWFDTEQMEFLPKRDYNPSFYNVRTVDWVQVDDNSFYLCSSNGLFRFDSTRNIANWYHKRSKPALSSNEVYDVAYVDSTLYIATSVGIDILHKDTFRRIGSSQGLSNDIVVSLLADSNTIWAGTYNGLSRIDRKTLKIENFFTHDGLPDNEFNRVARSKGPDGSLHFGTQNGVVSFFPDEVRRENSNYPIAITSFSRFDKEGNRVNERMLPFGNKEPLVLPAQNKYFQLEVALLCFVEPESNKYTYFMEGLENDWRVLSSSNIIQYNNLPSGKYTLRVKGLNAAGEYSSNEIRILLDVRQHLYKRWYFIVFVTSLLLGIVGFFYRRRMHYRMEVERLRSRLSRDLHDEIGSALTGISMQLQLLELKSKKENRPTVARISESSKEIVSRFRDYLWAVDSRSDSWLSLKDQMTEYLQRHLDTMDVQYTFNAMIDKSAHSLAPDIKQNLYLIFKEAITNVLKHAAATHIMIQLSQRGRGFYLSVKDDGMASGASGSLTGQGMKNMASRAEAIGAEFRVIKQDGFEIQVKKG